MFCMVLNSECSIYDGHRPYMDGDLKGEKLKRVGYFNLSIVLKETDIEI